MELKKNAIQATSFDDSVYLVTVIKKRKKIRIKMDSIAIQIWMLCGYIEGVTFLLTGKVEKT